MLHLKQKIQLENGYYREYKSSDFFEIFNLFLVLQNRIKTKYFDERIGKTDFFQLNMLKNKFSNMIGSCDYVGVAIDRDRNKIFGFGAYRYYGDVVILDFMFKNEEYIFNAEMKRVIIDSMKRFNKPIRVYLGDREKFDSYVKFVMRTFKHKHIGEDDLGRVVLDFDLTKYK
jgi:hypothetical protein